MRTAMSDSFKAQINNYAKSHKLPAQIVLQNYMFERFLARLSVSKYKRNFILKGGLLISSIAGLETRTTKDMDMTLKNLPLTEEKVLGILDEIFDIPLSDNITFRVQSTESIREDDQYGGLRIHVVAQYDIVPVNISIDISTGDSITPQERLFEYKKIFDKDSLSVYVYPMETLLAEKVETILRRSIANTRFKDFYDVHLLFNMQNIDKELFRQAIIATSIHRQSEDSLKNAKSTIKEIELDNSMQMQWKVYASQYPFAKGIEFNDILQTIRYMIEDINL